MIKKMWNYFLENSSPLIVLKWVALSLNFYLLVKAVSLGLVVIHLSLATMILGVFREQRT